MNSVTIVYRCCRITHNEGVTRQPCNPTKASCLSKQFMQKTYLACVVTCHITKASHAIHAILRKLCFLANKSFYSHNVGVTRDVFQSKYSIDTTNASNQIMLTSYAMMSEDITIASSSELFLRSRRDRELIHMACVTKERAFAFFLVG